LVALLKFLNSRLYRAIRCY